MTRVGGVVGKKDPSALLVGWKLLRSLWGTEGIGVQTRLKEVRYAATEGLTLGQRHDETSG